MGCSYEPKQDINLTTNPGAKWVRAPGMPAWNDCFPCIFYDNCRGAKDASFCVPSLKRYGIYMLSLMLHFGCFYLFCLTKPLTCLQVTMLLFAYSSHFHRIYRSLCHQVISEAWIVCLSGVKVDCIINVYHLTFVFICGTLHNQGSLKATLVVFFLSFFHLIPRAQVN